MMDPITAFSVAGTALQFAELAFKLIRKSIEYSAAGGSQEHEALRDLLGQLSASNIHLESSLVQQKISGNPQGSAKALLVANEECLKISTEVHSLLKELKLDAKFTLWRSVKLALKTITTKERFQSLIERLEHARANLTLSLMMYIQDQTAHNHETLRHQHESLYYETNKLTKGTVGMVSDIADLTTMFLKFKLENESLSGKWEKTLQRHSVHLQSVSQQIFKMSMMLGHEFATISDQIQKLFPIVDTEILARRKILESLYFNKMYARRHRIVRAHRSSYQWLFKHKENDTDVWHDFVDWLCCDHDQPIYWISGKPGSGKTTLMRELEAHVLLEITLGRNDAITPQQESLEWLTVPRDAKKDLLSLSAISSKKATSLEILTTCEFPDVSRSILQTSLKTKIEHGNLLVASRYFWYAGSAEERSICGLLKTIIHQLLSQRPDLIDKVVPPSIWYSARCKDSLPIHWEEPDLIQCLHDIASQTKGNDQILLLIDGLDECSGAEDEQENLLMLINSLAPMQHVKTCVASRHWNIFRAAFKDRPQLRLEDLTKMDIENYVLDQFEKDQYFQHAQQNSDLLLAEITQKIIDRARGVFLWVFLVVRDLLRYLRDGGNPSNLLRELGRMPHHLDEYFGRMLESISPSHRKDGAMILLTASCKMDYENDEGRPISGLDLLLIHLNYLDEEGHLDFSKGSHVEFAFDSSHIHVLERLERRLASRCMGLLELDALDLHNGDVGDSSKGHFVLDENGIYRFVTKAIPLHNPRPEDARIEFLHRTVRDYLALESSQQVLKRYVTDKFDPHWFRCNLLVLDGSSFLRIGRANSSLRAFACFFQHITSLRSAENVFLLFERAVQLLNDEFAHYGSNTKCVTEGSTRDLEVLAEAILNWSKNQSNAMSLAIQLNWTPYVMSRLSRQLIHEKRGRALLDYALRPRYSSTGRPESTIVKELLRLGANPSCPALPWTPTPIWTFYFQSLQYDGMLDPLSSFDIIRGLLRYGLDTTISRHLLLSSHQELCRDVRNDPQGERVTFLGEDGTKLNQHAYELQRTRLKLLYPDSFKSYEGTYSAIAVLHSLVHLSGAAQGQSLLTDAELADFGRIAEDTAEAAVDDFHTTKAQSAKRTRSTSMCENESNSKSCRFDV